jgi:endonuclease/exonuclease/phosphatase (EEP) superfamily protein YafD
MRSLLAFTAGSGRNASAADVGRRVVTTGAARLLLRARFLAAAAVGAISVLVLLPDRLKLDQWTPFAQVVAFRPAFAAATVVLGILMLTRRGAWPSAVALMVVGVVAAVTVLPGTVPSPELAVGGRVLSVLSFNVYDGRANAAVLAKIIRDRRPDLVALPEAGDGFRLRLDRQLVAQGYRSWSSRGPGEPDIDSVTVLAASSAGAVHVRVGTEATFPYLELGGGTLGRLRFVAFHAMAPVPGATDQWRNDIGLLRRWCNSSVPAIVAGDLNATLYHSVLRDSLSGCSDAADRRGQGLVGTWPSTWPRWFAVPIDHVLATSGIDAIGVHVLDMPGSDHRAIFASLRIRE